jgi:hypothetical protein
VKTWYSYQAFAFKFNVYRYSLVAEFMSEADTSYRGKINMGEFLAYVRSKDEVLRSTFRALDTVGLYKLNSAVYP